MSSRSSTLLGPRWVLKRSRWGIETFHRRLHPLPQSICSDVGIGFHASGPCSPDQDRERPEDGHPILPQLRRTWTLCGEVSVKSQRPLVSRGALVGIIPMESSSKHRTCLPVIIGWGGQLRKTTALIDSGAEENFLDAGAAVAWGVPITNMEHPLVANSLNGQLLAKITHISSPLSLRISGNHHEETKLYIIDSPHSPIILGHPWLTKHGPSLDWRTHSIMEMLTSWSYAEILGAAL
ncbi:hypothetical protein SKAU_G00019740 [Synaphobranchus kaupii]|uniref:Uncharacterized protein n=1 Tax=Synaphobranchus kaupii TaxID=118154 RepID=A0A9Q1GBK3_SYNKA|nr:hypothetical protein SKAU_G00019740 [Synaphobranchus kaupii]